MKKIRITKASLDHLTTCVRTAMFFAGVAIFLSTNNLFSGCGKPTPGGAIVPTLPADTLSAILAPYESRISHLADRNIELKRKVDSIAQELTESKQNALLLEGKLKRRIQTVASLSNNVDLPPDCDSLRLAASEYLDSQIVKDSLYQTLNDHLSLQLSNRDSTLQVRAMQLGALQLEYNRTQLLNSTLIMKQDALQQSYKKQKTKNRLLTAGLVIVGGTAAGLLMAR